MLPLAGLALMMVPAARAVPATETTGPACGAASATAGSVRLPRTERAVRVAGSVELAPESGPPLRLAGLLVPDADAAAAQAEIRDFAGTGELLASGPAATDRHGRRVVRIRRARDGADLAGRLVESGLALLTGDDDAGDCLLPLRAAEARARAARRGLWARGSAGPFSADDPALAAHAGQFALVEGTILSTGQTSRMRFLNFGGHWSLDFTVTISESDRQGFVSAGVDPATLAGARVRVRGWLVSRDGGAMRLFHPGQIERLGMSE